MLWRKTALLSTLIIVSKPRSGGFFFQSPSAAIVTSFWGREHGFVCSDNVSLTEILISLYGNLSR